MKNSLHGGFRGLCENPEKRIEQNVSVKDSSENDDREERVEEYIKIPR